MADTYKDQVETEPSSEHSAIVVRDIQERLPQLTAKLREYQARIENDQSDFVHPEQLILEGRMGNRFKAAILESLFAQIEDISEDKIYLHTVAIDVQDRIGLPVAVAATVPFRYNQNGMVYEPDVRRLYEETNSAAVAFSEAYVIIKGYCSGDLWGIEGGTGLPS